MLHHCCSIGSVAVGALLAQPGDVPSTVDALVAMCSERRQVMGTFMVQGMAIRGRASAETESSLASLWQTMTIERGEVVLLADAVLEAIPSRECFALQMWVEPDLLVVDRVRSPVLDTTAAFLESKRLPEQIMKPPAVHERIHLWSDGQILIQDGAIVSTLSQHTRTAALLAIDMTLADWQPATDEALLAPGQTTTVEIDPEDPGRAALVISGPTSAPWGEPSTAYMFATAGGFHAASIRGGYPTGDLRRVDYLADVGDPDGLPIAVLDRTRGVGDTEWFVEVTLLGAVACGANVAAPALRLPAVRLEVVPVPGSDDLQVTRVVPPWLAEVPAEERLAVAFAGVLAHWGSDSLDYDLNGDGIVDDADLARAEVEFG